MAALILVLAQARQVHIDLASYRGAAIAVFVLGGFAAASARAMSWTNTAQTLACLAIFAAFTNLGATLNLLLQRPGAILIDPYLMRADALLGFDWRSGAEFVSRWSGMAHVMARIYESTLLQVVALIIFLGATGRAVALHRFMLVGVVGSCAALAIWAWLPSVGPAAWTQLDPSVLRRVGVLVDGTYKQQLLAALQGPPSVIGRSDLAGLIAFPSMHTVMAAMVVYYARRTPIFVPAVLLNIPMIPAIIIQGGHHVTDVIGGGALFCAVAGLAARLVPASPAMDLPSRPPQLHTASGGKLIRIASMLPPVFRPNSVPRS